MYIYWIPYIIIYVDITGDEQVAAQNSRSNISETNKEKIKRFYAGYKVFTSVGKLILNSRKKHRNLQST